MPAQEPENSKKVFNSHIKGVGLRLIGKKNDPAIAGFIKLYISTFAEPPYKESLNVRQVRGVWDSHINHCIICVELKGEVIGFGCAHAALAKEWQKLKDYLLEKKDLIPGDLGDTIFFSELAVSSTMRRQGIAKRIVKERLLWAKRKGFEYYLLRTASENKSSGPLYISLGAIKLPIEQDMSEDYKAAGIKTSWPNRIFLWGSIDQALGVIQK
ncbi:MAG: GNAT family N-acetyltransferase [Bdellovibrionota bacterium]